MITIERARELRRLILKASKSLNDEDALEGIELFPMWKEGVDYKKGDREQHTDGFLYRCEQNHTSQAEWAPNVTPALWTRISIEKWPEWRQPTGEQDSYNKGDQTSWVEKHWISDLDANVWEPGVYGWTEHVEQ